MKNQFFQYNMKKSGAIDNIIKNGTIILDTNALLNVYRFSKDNREKYFEILNAVKDRLFLTYHSVQEFYKNRLKIIYNKSKFKECLQEALIKELTNINNMIENSNFQGDKRDSCNLIKYEENLKTSLIKILNDAKDMINKEINSYEIYIDHSFIYNDIILDKILEIFDGKINNEFTDEELNRIYKEGDERYKNEIPPGYKDIKKSIPERYGDLVIWKELIKISKTQQKDILFVSDDRKTDWCEKFNEYDLGPRKELIKELFKETNQKFHSITTKEFIKHISDLYTIENTKGLEIESDIIERDLLESSSTADLENQLERDILEARDLDDKLERDLLELSCTADLGNQSDKKI